MLLDGKVPSGCRLAGGDLTAALRAVGADEELESARGQDGA